MCTMSKSTTSELVLQLDAILGNTKLGTDESWDRNVTRAKSKSGWSQGLVPWATFSSAFHFSHVFAILHNQACITKQTRQED